MIKTAYDDNGVAYLLEATEEDAQRISRLLKAVDNKVHYLKTLPEHFCETLCGRKTFEVRIDDRNFQVGDELVLEEYKPPRGYTKRRITAIVTSKLKNEYCKEGYCIMSIKIVDADNVPLGRERWK